MYLMFSGICLHQNRPRVLIGSYYWESLWAMLSEHLLHLFLGSRGGPVAASDPGCQSSSL